MTQRRTNKNSMMQIVACLLLLVVSTFTSCTRKDLFLRIDQSEIRININDISLDMLWGNDWRTGLLYNWDDQVHGRLGYTEPEWIRATIYDLNSSTFNRTGSFNRNFTKAGGRVSLTAGQWYDMLFYNADTEYIIFGQNDLNSDYMATTRSTSHNVYTRASEEDADMPSRYYSDYNQPDQLFGSFIDDMQISEDPDHYEHIIDSLGNVVSVFNIETTLKPYTFIYLLQVVIVNNNDDKGARVLGGKGLTLTGMAQGVELFSRRTHAEAVSVTTEDVKPTQSFKNLELPNGTTADCEIFASRIVSWGLPDVAPLQERTKGSTEVKEENHIGVGLVTRSGYVYNYTVDITEQMHQRPTGGVITIIVDAGEIDDKYIDKPQGGGNNNGGGFNASVENWGNEYNASVTI